MFRNRSPRYRPFATQGVYRHVRQPIYLAFSLILWLTAVWTPDQIILAAILTGYCVIGAAMKERRYVRFFGEAYRAYQARVPFWLPFRRRASRESAATAPVAEHDCDTIVVGAGPVGLLLANQLGRRGLKVLVVERRCAPPDGSMAIGITPPSLAILKTLGLDREFARRGVAIDTARVHENRRHLGDVDFSRLPAEHRFILSLPQVETIAILRRNLALFPSVRVMDGVEFVGAESGRHGVRVTVRGVESGAACAYRAAWLAGCDGHRSAVRRAAGIRVRGRAYGCRFLMADFEDRSGLGREAHLYFGRGGSVESFPLPAGRRRWVVLAEKTPRAGEAIAEGVVRRVRERAGFDLAGATVRFESAFAPARQLAATYVRGRVVLCGDAAHVLSPIGGQGMNTGFADAAHLADALADAHANPAAAAGVLADYEAQRRRAFRVAAGRAARGMWLGTRTGSLFSGMRRFLIARLLLRPTIRERLAPYFAMLTIPGSDRWVAAAPATAGGPER